MFYIPCSIFRFYIKNNILHLKFYIKTHKIKDMEEKQNGGKTIIACIACTLFVLFN